MNTKRRQSLQAGILIGMQLVRCTGPRKIRGAWPAAAVTAIGLLAAHIALGFESRTSAGMGLNLRLLDWLYAARPAGLTQVAVAISAATEPMLMAVLALLWSLGLWLMGARRKSVLLFAAPTSALFVAEVSKLMFREPRPPLGQALAS